MGRPDRGGGGGEWSINSVVVPLGYFSFICRTMLVLSRVWIEVVYLPQDCPILQLSLHLTLSQTLSIRNESVNRSRSRGSSSRCNQWSLLGHVIPPPKSTTTLLHPPPWLISSPPPPPPRTDRQTRRARKERGIKIRNSYRDSSNARKISVICCDGRRDEYELD